METKSLIFTMLCLSSGLQAYVDESIYEKSEGPLRFRISRIFSADFWCLIIIVKIWLLYSVSKAIPRLGFMASHALLRVCDPNS